MLLQPYTLIKKYNGIILYHRGRRPVTRAEFCTSATRNKLFNEQKPLSVLLCLIWKSFMRTEVNHVVCAGRRAINHCEGCKCRTGGDLTGPIAWMSVCRPLFYSSRPTTRLLYCLYWSPTSSCVNLNNNSLHCLLNIVEYLLSNLSHFNCFDYIKD